MGNPIVTDAYTSDPAVLVHDGTVFLYTGHDEAPAGVEKYVMRDWLCFSSTDLLTWRPRGPLLEVPGNCTTNRPAIVEFGGDWYFFYHNGVLPGGGPRRRSVCVDRLTYADDGRMNLVHMTTSGLG